MNGAHIVRVHDVKAMRSVVEIVDAIRQSRHPEPEPQPALKPGLRPPVKPAGNAGNSAFRAVRPPRVE
jgi:hypothetical protein